MAGTLAELAAEQKRMEMEELQNHHMKAKGTTKAQRSLGYRKKRMKRRKAQKQARKNNRRRK